MAAALRTDVGKVRQQNEDSAWMDESRCVFAVADGMGGHQAGEVASRLAVEAVQKTAESGAVPTEALLRQMVRSANDSILSYAAAHSECAGMGTTLSVLWRNGSHAYIAHIGDSRVYRLRAGKLEQVTEDHSLVWELMRAGIITEEEARVHPRRNIIVRALGSSGEDAPDIMVVRSLPGDVWMLCSDGLCGYVENSRIQEVLSEHASEEAADLLLQDALDAGGKDNITVIVARHEEEETWNRD